MYFEPDQSTMLSSGGGGGGGGGGVQDLYKCKRCTTLAFSCDNSCICN